VRVSRSATGLDCGRRPTARTGDGLECGRRPTAGLATVLSAAAGLRPDWPTAYGRFGRAERPADSSGPGLVPASRLRFRQSPHRDGPPPHPVHSEAVMGITDEVKKRSLQLMGDPRVAKLMQNEQFMKAMMTFMQVSGKVNSFTTEQTERVARTMRLATAQEVKDLRRTVKNLEAEVARLRKQLEERR
jgi:hypothetical protein